MGPAEELSRLPQHPLRVQKLAANAAETTDAAPESSHVSKAAVEARVKPSIEAGIKAGVKAIGIRPIEAIGKSRPIAIPVGAVSRTIARSGGTAPPEIGVVLRCVKLGRLGRGAA